MRACWTWMPTERCAWGATESGLPCASRRRSTGKAGHAGSGAHGGLLFAGAGIPEQHPGAPPPRSHRRGRPRSGGHRAGRVSILRGAAYHSFGGTMTFAVGEKLALLGGTKAIHDPLPTFSQSAGRTFGPEEEALLLSALRSGCLSRNGGTLVKRLEAEFAAALGTRYAAACSHGSAAVHLAVAALDPEPGDEF